MASISSLVWLIAAPLVLALAAFVLGGKWHARLGLAAAGLVVIGTIAVTWLVWRDGPQSYALGNWAAPLGIRLHADGLACVMLLMSSGVGAVVSIYARSFFSEGEATQFWPSWLLMWSGLNALFLSGDIFNLYVALELITLAGVGQVVIAGTREATAAALRYLLAALAGSLFYLAGVVLIYATTGALDVATLGARATPNAPLQVALLVMMVGLMLKAALFPFHFWLPDAHGRAPAPASALLSGLVVKTGFYILLRLWFDLFPAEVTSPVAILPTLLGSAAIVWGSWQAMVAERLKMLVAYSTVAQLGYLFLIFGLADPDREGAFDVWSAGALFALSHALAKGSFFLAAGTILRVAGNEHIRELATVAHRLPMTFFAMGCASLSLMGMPPTAAFVAKWAMLMAALDRGRIELAVIIIVGGLLAAAYLFRVLAAAFVAPDDDTPIAPEAAVPRVLEYTTLTLALASVLLGLVSWPLMELLQIGSPWQAAAFVEGVSR